MSPLLAMLLLSSLLRDVAVVAIAAASRSHCCFVMLPSSRSFFFLGILPLLLLLFFLLFLHPFFHFSSSSTASSLSFVLHLYVSFSKISLFKKTKHLKYLAICHCTIDLNLRLNCFYYIILAPEAFLESLTHKELYR